MRPRLLLHTAARTPAEGRPSRRARGSSAACAVCDSVDVAKVHIAGLERAETAGQRYLVCSKNQLSTQELAEMAVAAVPEAAAGIDLAAWRADEAAAKMQPKRPATDNRKACALLGVPELVLPQKSVEDAARSLHALGGLASE